MIAIDTTCDEEILQELRARTFAATVQKLRKTAGLVVADKVEIFYEEEGGLVSAAMLKHSESTVKRIKSLPLECGLMPQGSVIIIKEVANDPDISKQPVTITLTQPCASVDLGTIALLSPEVNVQMAAMYLQSMDYDRLSTLQSVEVTVDSVPLILHKGIHYFLTANDMVISTGFSGRSKFLNLPTAL